LPLAKLSMTGECSAAFPAHITSAGISKGDTNPSLIYVAILSCVSLGVNGLGRLVTQL